MNFCLLSLGNGPAALRLGRKSGSSLRQTFGGQKDFVMLFGATFLQNRRGLIIFLRWLCVVEKWMPMQNMLR